MLVRLRRSGRVVIAIASSVSRAIAIRSNRIPGRFTNAYVSFQSSYSGKKGQIVVFMITTNDQHEVQPFSFMRTPGFKTWRTAGLNVWKTYFLLSYACKEGRTWVSQGMLLWCEQDLLGFCEQACENPSKRIYQITKLVPPEPDQIGMWRSVAIKEIWHCTGSDQRDELFYVAEESNQQSSRSANDQQNSRRMKKIFDAS